MKFDMSRAWNEAMALFSANGSLMAVIAGLFVFLPNLALYMLAPEVAQPPETAGVEDPEVMMQIMGEFYSNAAPWMIGIGVIGLIGSLSMYALVTAARPTVGEALKTGIFALIPAILAQLLLGICLGVLGAVLIGVPIAIGVPALAVVTGLLFMVLVFYIIVKTSLVAPAIVIEDIKNPIAALQRSWRLTKGNSFRLFGFFVILLVCIVVVAAVFGIVTGLFVALLGDGTVGLLLSGILNGVMSAVFAVLGVCILSAVHRQLSGPAPETMSETFE